MRRSTFSCLDSVDTRKFRLNQSEDDNSYCLVMMILRRTNHRHQAAEKCKRRKRMKTGVGVRYRCIGSPHL